MDESRYGTQHGRQATEIMSRTAWESQQLSWRSSHTRRQLDNPLRPRYEPAIHSPRDTGPTWLRRQSFGSISSLLMLLIVSLCVVPASAAFLEFDNCLSEDVQSDEPLQLQFVPKFLDAKFNTSDPSNNLQVTVWGDVAGSGTEGNLADLPPPTDPYWGSSDASRGGKIQDVPPSDPKNPKLTTLFNKVEVLTYQPWHESVDFCGQVVNGTCPLAPRFDANQSNPYELPAYGFSHNFFSSYAFTSFTTTLSIKYGDSKATNIGCVSAKITPDLGTSLSDVLTFIPLVVLVTVGVATAFAGVFSPWGTTDTFRWTTNYGRDEDLLRLVTPGFGDCLQYIQFIALTGGLTLNYPGFYQPVVSKVSWSALMFNQSFVTGKPGPDSLVDGVYVTSGPYGLDRLRQLIGANEADDIWAGMTVWLLVILGSVLALIQAGFLLRWIFRHISETPEEDLRAKNMPFSMGNVIRVVFNYFLLPAVALSTFQLVIAKQSPTYAIALASVMLLLIVGFAAWLLYLIATTKPKSFLFDDLPTVLLYGSLYNTFSDNAAPFALVPVLVTFIRGVAIGAVQPSGVAQLVLLAICEIITVLTLHAFRPFHSPTSMNAYHTFFAALRFATILLMISFAPSLGVGEGPKGWIGYAVLLMHAIVLIFGFLLNAVQTIVEVGARLAGAGGDESGATRGGLAKVFGMRQLSRRLSRRDAGSRQSELSTAMLEAEKGNSSYMMENGRLRSQSIGSAGVLLNSHPGLGIDAIDPFGAIPPQQPGSGISSYAPTTQAESSTFSFLPSGAGPSGSGQSRSAVLGMSAAEAADPYYRPPRIRRLTLDAYSPGARSRGSLASGDLADPDQIEPFDGPSISGRVTPVPQASADGSAGDPRGSKADYTTREVDFYYGVRGPALNANVPSRRIKTGPTDPTGIPASAAGWLKGLLGGKTKEKGKGFEVVRSSRMPPGMVARNGPGGESPPEGIPVATAGGVRNGPIDSDDESSEARRSNRGQARPAAPVEGEERSLVSSMGSDDEDSQDEDYENIRISDVPALVTRTTSSDDARSIKIPERSPSRAISRGAPRVELTEMTDIPLGPDVPFQVPPSVPRKSSRRKSQNIDLAQSERDLLHAPNSSGLLGSSEASFGHRNSTSGHSTTSTGSSSGDRGDRSYARDTSALGHFSADLRGDRPTSVGYVHQHSIQTINPPENHRSLGASAEIVDSGRISADSSAEHQRT